MKSQWVYRVTISINSSSQWQVEYSQITLTIAPLMVILKASIVPEKRERFYHEEVNEQPEVPLVG